MYFSKHDQIMKIITKLLLLFLLLINSCAEYSSDNRASKIEKQYYNSKGFALIYDDDLYKSGVVSKKLKDEVNYVMHSTLKRNTPVRVINPENLKFVEAKISTISTSPERNDTILIIDPFNI